MPARGTVTLFHVRGIRIGVDYSWFFVLFLIILWLSSFYRDVLDVSNGDAEPYLLALASALAFFASILLHELGHAFVADPPRESASPTSPCGCSAASRG